MKTGTMGVLLAIILGAGAARCAPNREYQKPQQEQGNSRQKHQVSPSPKDSEKAQGNQESAQNETPSGNAAAEASRQNNGTNQHGLLIVAVGTMLFIAWQAYETRRAADSASKNIKVQVAAMQQWVAVVECQDITQGGSGESDACFYFEIRNPTAYPLTLLSGRVDVNSQKTDFSANRRLVPQESYPVFANTALTTEQKRQREGKGLTLNVIGVIYYKNALGKRVPQPFGVTACLHAGQKTLFSPYVGYLPYPVKGEGADPQKPIV